MTTVVTARVPEGVRARGVDILHEIGSSTSELINAAFEYVIAERELPKSRARLENSIQTHKLSHEQREQVAAFLENVKVPVPKEWDSAPFEDLLDNALGERYAHLR